MDGNNQPQQPFQPASGPAPQPVMPPQPQPFQPAPQPMQPQQPFGTPVGPVSPAGPVGPAPVGAPYQMPPKKGLSKGALWGIIGGVIGLIVLIVGIVLAVVLLGGPSKEDYSNGLKDAQQVVEKYNTVDGKMQVSPRAARTAFDEYKESADKLADMKALGDKEVKAAYDDFKEKHDKLSKIFPLVLDAAEACSDVSPRMGVGGQSLVDSFKHSLEPCRKATQKIIDEDIDEEITKAMKDMLAMFDQVIDIMDEMERAQATGDVVRHNRAVNRFRSLRQPKFTASDRLDKLSAKDELNKLNDVLRAKANK